MMADGLNYRRSNPMNNLYHRLILPCKQCHGVLTIKEREDGAGGFCPTCDGGDKLIDITPGLDKLIEDMALTGAKKGIIS